MDYSADSSKCEWLPLPFGNDKESISTEEAFLKRFIEFVKKCGYEYDPAVGDPDNGIAPGTAWEDVPEDFLCPICGLGKEVFEEA